VPTGAGEAASPAPVGTATVGLDAGAPVAVASFAALAGVAPLQLQAPAASQVRPAAPTPVAFTGQQDPLLPSRPDPQSPALPLGPVLPSAPAPGYGVGGSIRILGRSVTIGDNAVIDASGPLGGGEILVGGGWQGLNPNIITSQFTYLAKSAMLYANADLRGNGGLVVVWANDTARIYGKIAARGGELGGDGGNIETSGKRLLDVTQVADASGRPVAAGPEQRGHPERRDGQPQPGHDARSADDCDCHRG
jgi:hypothetical protein